MTWREYHNATKHTPESLRRRRHYARLGEYARSVSPLRRRSRAGSSCRPALSSDPHIGRTQRQIRPEQWNKGAEFLSQLLFYSAAISATKAGTFNRIPVCAASQSFLGQSASYRVPLLYTRPAGLARRLYHYRPSSHMAEQRALGDFTSRLDVDAPLVFLLTSIAWREAWKYQDRAYRYCLLDIGHAWQSLTTGCACDGCECIFDGTFRGDRSLADCAAFTDDEWPMLIVSIDGAGIPLRDPDPAGTTQPLRRAQCTLEEYVPYRNHRRRASNN